jgi:hypothetical protein
MRGKEVEVCLFFVMFFRDKTNASSTPGSSNSQSALKTSGLGNDSTNTSAMDSQSDEG